MNTTNENYKVSSCLWCSYVFDCSATNNPQLFMASAMANIAAWWTSNAARIKTSPSCRAALSFDSSITRLSNCTPRLAASRWARRRLSTVCNGGSQSISQRSSRSAIALSSRAFHRAKSWKTSPEPPLGGSADRISHPSKNRRLK